MFLRSLSSESCRRKLLVSFVLSSIIPLLIMVGVVFLAEDISRLGDLNPNLSVMMIDIDDSSISMSHTVTNPATGF